MLWVSNGGFPLGVLGRSGAHHSGYLPGFCQRIGSRPMVASPPDAPSPKEWSSVVSKWKQPSHLLAGRGLAVESHQRGSSSQLFDNQKVVGLAGFEPTTPCPPGRCATRLRYSPLRERMAKETGQMRIGKPEKGDRRAQRRDCWGLATHRRRVRPEFLKQIPIGKTANS